MADYNDLLRYALTVALLVSFVNELTIVLASLAAIFIALRLIVLEIEVTCYGAIALYLLATLLHWDSPNQLWLAVFNLALLARLSIH